MQLIIIVYFSVHTCLFECVLCVRVCHQSHVAQVEPWNSENLPKSGKIGDVLLAGVDSGISQHSSECIRALQPTRLAHRSTGCVYDTAFILVYLYNFHNSLFTISLSCSIRISHLNKNHLYSRQLIC